MTDPPVLAAAITGAVAFAVAAVTTWLNLRHQRKGEDQRRQHDRRMRVFDSAIKAAVDFLAAADRTRRTRQVLDSANRALDNAKSSADQQAFEHYRTNVMEARETAFAATEDAENAYTGIRLLVPAAADQARRYLDFCISADIHPDETKVDRERAQKMVEDTIQRALGGDLPDNSVITEAGSQAGWLKILWPRRSNRQALPGAPRQP